MITVGGRSACDKVNRPRCACLRNLPAAIGTLGTETVIAGYGLAADGWNASTGQCRRRSSQANETVKGAQRGGSKAIS
jgi:hypothetical protein